MRLESQQFVVIVETYAALTDIIIMYIEDHDYILSLTELKA